MVAKVKQRVPGYVEGKLEVINGNFLSPLRYPGGKRRLVSYVAQMLDKCKIKKIDQLVEPFAGGAAISLALLEAGIVEKVVLSDLDPLIAAFWTVVFSSDNKHLVDRIRKTEISINLWKKLKTSNPKTLLNMAFKCLYLNRTSFSGSLATSTGPIGGMTQRSKYKIDCRFNRERIAERIENLAQFKTKVQVYNMDFRQLVTSIRSSRENSKKQYFWYLDPPFFHKANKLYRFYFNDNDHKELQKLLTKLNGRWVLSYDLCKETIDAFQNHPGYRLIDTRYTAGRPLDMELSATAEVVVSNLFK